MGLAGKAPAVIFLLFSAAVVSASAFNITLILEKYPVYREFNDLLTKTNLAGEINLRNSITVLVVSNDAMMPITSQTEAIQRKILATHVVLDYIDQLKLEKIKNNNTVLTTLLQATGGAQGRQGYLNIGQDQGGGVVFGSASPGSSLDARVIGFVASQPNTISIIRISQAIFANGIDDVWTPVPPPPPSRVPPPPPAPAPPKQAVPAPSPPKEAVPSGPTANAGASPSTAPTASPTADKSGPDNGSPAGASSAAVKEVVCGVVLLSLAVAFL